MLEVELTDCPARRLAAVRHVGPYIQVGSAFQQLFAWAGPRGLFGPGTEVVGIYHDNPRTTPPEALRADACLTAPPGFEGDAAAGVGVVEIPAGRYAVGVHRGPYERLAEAYNWFACTWLAASGHTPDARPCFEVYLNSPMDTKPDDLLTAIHIPIVG